MKPSIVDEPFRISVVGIARPQGSKSARIVRGRPILTDGFGADMLPVYLDAP